MCEHRDGSESAVAYSKHAPIIIVSTGEASARLGVRLTPNCSVNSGPEAILDFKAAAHSVHICCFAGPGAQCVRHKVTVPRGVQRFAYVLRCLQQGFRGLKSAQSGEPYQQLIHQCEQASQPIWDLLTAAVQVWNRARCFRGDSRAEAACALSRCICAANRVDCLVPWPGGQLTAPW